MRGKEISNSERDEEMREKVEVFVGEEGSWRVRKKIKRCLDKEDEENKEEKKKWLVIFDKMKRRERHLMAKLCVV